MNTDEATHYNDDGKEPVQITSDGREYNLVTSNRWLLRYATEDRQYVKIIPRSPIDDTLLESVQPSQLDIREKNDAALALAFSGKRNLPRVWQELVDDWREKQKPKRNIE